MENKQTIDTEKDDVNHWNELFRRLPVEIKQSLPLSLSQLTEVTGRPLQVDKSSSLHTDQIACFWFYKPISQMFKTFEE